MEEAKLFSISPFDFYPIATALADEDEIGMQPVKLVNVEQSLCVRRQWLSSARANELLLP